MTFSSNYEQVKEWLEQTAECATLIRLGDTFPSEGFPDIRRVLERIHPEGTWLDEGELSDLQQVLHCLHETLRFFRTVGDEGRVSCPRLIKLSATIPAFPSLSRHMESLLDKNGKMRDEASPELARIRRELAVTAVGISRSLLSILRSAQAEGWVEKDAVPTLRDGRLVIPLAPAYKRKIRGIVHDESATGKTVFIEPDVVVEANNRIRELEGEEKREIIRLLITLTAEIRPLVEELLNSLAFLAEIDFIRAKALWANETGGELPVLGKEAEIDWFHAVHPLLYLSLRRQGREVVPIEISLNAKQRILVISGPNAGGKSVCLKTVGLLQYMLQCGMLIPVHANSRAGIFSRILIDIGDSQSIENDLSTYSSHLANMKRFLRLCSETTLLLIDEFGSGTEPRIGGAIAETLLDRFNRRGSFGVITTHYTNLKHFAEATEGIANGAMLYDRHRMEPLFHLAIGNPGSSFAIEIARRMGLPEDVIADASGKVGEDYVDMDRYLQDIVRDKRYWENKRQEVRRLEKDLETLTTRYEQDIDDLERQRKSILGEAHEEAVRTIATANARIEQTIREIREAQAEKERTKELRRQLEGENFFTPTPDFSPLHRHKKKKIHGKQLVDTTPVPTVPVTGEGMAVGQYVRLRGQTVAGKILSIQGEKALVAFGDIKSLLPFTRLEKSRKAEAPAVVPSMFSSGSRPLEAMHERRLRFRQELDLHGLHAEEAKEVITRYIDDAILLGARQVYLIHGTGNGVLRRIVKEQLDDNPAIRRCTEGHPDYGGAGVTVVEFC
jgi:DNA mismatch repair protein MutS2